MSRVLCFCYPWDLCPLLLAVLRAESFVSRLGKEEEAEDSFVVSWDLYSAVLFFVPWPLYSSFAKSFVSSHTYCIHFIYSPFLTYYSLFIFFFYRFLGNANVYSFPLLTPSRHYCWRLFFSCPLMHLQLFLKGFSSFTNNFVTPLFYYFFYNTSFIYSFSPFICLSHSSTVPYKTPFLCYFLSSSRYYSLSFHFIHPSFIDPSFIPATRLFQRRQRNRVSRRATEGQAWLRRLYFFVPL